MKANAALFLLLAIAFSCCLAGAQETGNTPPSRHMTLQDAVQLAPKHNHDIRIASYTVEEKQHAKEIAKNSYLPSYETTASFCHLTDTQLIEINAGSLGVAGGAGPQNVGTVLSFSGVDAVFGGISLGRPIPRFTPAISLASDLLQISTNY